MSARFAEFLPLRRGHFLSCPRRTGRGGSLRCWCKVIGYTLLIAIATAVSYVELVGSFESQSLALLGDGLHVLSDLAIYPLLFMGAIEEMSKGRSRETSKKWGLVISWSLVVIGVLMFLGAITRFLLDQDIHVHSEAMLVAAAWGLVGNIIMVLIMVGLKIDHHGHEHPDMAHQGGLIHLSLDTIGSVVATTGALLIHHGASSHTDVWAAVVIGALLVAGGFHNRKETLHHHH